MVTVLLGISKSFRYLRQPRAYPSNSLESLVDSKVSFQVSRLDSLLTTSLYKRGIKFLKCFATNCPMMGLSLMCRYYLALRSMKNSSCSLASKTSLSPPSGWCPEARYRRTSTFVDYFCGDRIYKGLRSPANCESTSIYLDVVI
jgi:hypothetical protein